MYLLEVEVLNVVFVVDLEPLKKEKINFVKVDVRQKLFLKRSKTQLWRFTLEINFGAQ